jgi:hypothetical protein
MLPILISSSRIEHALDRASSALSSGEKMTKKLVDSLGLLRERRDRLAVKLTEARAKEFPELEGIDWGEIFGVTARARAGRSGAEQRGYSHARLHAAVVVLIVLVVWRAAVVTLAV